MLSKIAVLRQASAQMEYQSHRQALVTENIANADTPGFRPRDLKPFDEQVRTARIDLAVSSDRHLKGRAGGGLADMQAKSYEVAPNGNGVVIEEQMLKMAAIQGTHQMASQIYRKGVELLRASFGRG